jgi:serine/threonine protein kinase
VQLIEIFQYKSSSSSSSSHSYAFVYENAVPCIEFISMRHKYSEELVVKILRQMLDAVQWLHLHGFVHLNIQPFTVLNANYTQVNIKLAGLENSRQLVELNASASSSSTIHDSVLLPVEFSGNLLFYFLFPQVIIANKLESIYLNLN